MRWIISLSQYIIKQWYNWTQKWWCLTHLLLPTITILACKWPNGPHDFFPTNKTFEGNLFTYCLEISPKGVMNSFCTWNHSVKKLLNLVLSFLWTCQLNKVIQHLIYICKLKTFSLVSSINLSQTDKAKASKPNFVTFFMYFGNSLLDY